MLPPVSNAPAQQAFYLALEAGGQEFLARVGMDVQPNCPCVFSPRDVAGSVMNPLVQLSWRASLAFLAKDLLGFRLHWVESTPFSFHDALHVDIPDLKK